MYILTWIIPGAFGGGDVKLVAACGWFLGVKAVVTGTFVGFLAGGTYAAVLLAVKKDRKERPLCIRTVSCSGVCCGSIFRKFSCRLVHQSVIACVWERRF